MKVSRSRLALALIVALALASTAATCGKAPRHTASLSLNAFAKGLSGAQAAEFVLFRAGKVSQQNHDAIEARIGQVAKLADDAQTTLDAWQPGQPVPHVLGAVIAAANPLLDDILALSPMDPALQAQVKQVYKAIADILVLVAGG